MNAITAAALLIGLYVGFYKSINDREIYVFAENKQAFDKGFGIRCDCTPGAELGSSAKGWKGEDTGGSCHSRIVPNFGKPIQHYTKNGKKVILKPPPDSCCQAFSEKVPQINGKKYTAMPCNNKNP